MMRITWQEEKGSGTGVEGMDVGLCVTERRPMQRRDGAQNYKLGRLAFKLLRKERRAHRPSKSATEQGRGHPDRKTGKMAYILMTELLHQLDLSQNPLGINRIFKSPGDLLDRHLLSGLLVQS